MKCIDCQSFLKTCKWLLSRTGEETECDWDPSRFRRKDPIVIGHHHKRGESHPMSYNPPPAYAKFGGSMARKLFNREAEIMEESFGGTVYVTDLLAAKRN